MEKSKLHNKRLRVKKNVSGIKKISAQKISQALEMSSRQYLAGNLKKPQEIDHIQDENVEVGISHYQTFTADTPHYHTHVTEYQMVLEGRTKIKDLHTKEITQLEEGDFYIVKAETPYAQKSQADTKIIFFKYPGMNDKVLVEIDAETLEWLKKFE